MSFETVIQRFASMARRHAARNALHAKGSFHTYGELAARVQGIRDAIRKSGMGGDELIGVLTGDDIQTYASILAILANGSAYVPINESNPAARNATIAEDAGLKLVLASRNHPPLEAVAERGRLAVLPTSETDPGKGELELPQIAPEALAYVLFTSGSTGKPKGVPIRHRSLTHFMQTMLDPVNYDFSNEDRFLQASELTFDVSVLSLFAPLCLGACCFVPTAGGVQNLKIVQMLEEHQITVAPIVPSVPAYLSRFFDEIHLPALRYCLLAGEALPQGLSEGWSRCAPNAVLQNAYGPTEATVYALIYTWDDKRSAGEAVNGLVPIGTPLRGMQAFVIDELGCVAERGQKGELVLTGPQLSDGYWNEPEKTGAAFVELEAVPGRGRVYRTGDICLLNEHGNHVYCGRIDSQVKVDGHRIELGEIEHHAREFTGHAQAVALLGEIPGGQMVIQLFVESNGRSAAEMMDHLKTKLPAYMLPAKIRFIEKMPLNRNGKIDRKALLQVSS